MDVSTEHEIERGRIGKLFETEQLAGCGLVRELLAGSFGALSGSGVGPDIRINNVPAIAARRANKSAEAPPRFTERIVAATRERLRRSE